LTAFNTVWTYDIYQAYVRKDASDQHYLWMGRMATVFGIALSVAAAYAATRFNNIMDFLQLVFAFVNAPLFATFLLGMFWKVVQELLRHASLKVTTDVYMQAVGPQKREAQSNLVKLVRKGAVLEIKPA
jgi:Na+/proline symporter